MDNGRSNTNTAGASVAAQRVSLARTRPTVHQSVQTEASFVPAMIDLKYAYEPQASEQFSQLGELRTVIQRCMQAVMGSVYDVVSFKDVMLKMEEEFPTNLPVTDMLLLSSKLFRTTAELGRLLGCFFGVVFADNYADEHFHFAEIRILQRELAETKRRLAEVDAERDRLQQMLDNVGQVALDHGRAVELLENHNQALQLQTNALEDQMALLFRQLNSDLEVSCKEAYEKVAMEMEVQERLNPTRTTFRQTMDSLSQQIRSSRSLIADVRETLMACNQGGRTGEAYLAVEPSVRFKLKMLDSGFQQLVGRFSSVKDSVVETAQELMNALHERKRILYLSFQHIRLYDMQSAKLRAGKAVLSELSNCTKDLLQRVQATFPSGAITSVDRIGRITTQRWHGGYTLAALRQRKAAALNGGGVDGNGGGGGLLPGLTEVEMMAAESELAAFEGESGVAVLGTEAASMAASEYVPPGISGPSSSVPPATFFNDASKLHAVPFENVHSLMDLARVIDADIVKLNEALTLEDEVSAFLKTLTLSVTSTARSDVMPDGTLFPNLSRATDLERVESDFERALMPTACLASQRQGSSLDGLTGRENIRTSGSDAGSDDDSGRGGSYANKGDRRRRDREDSEASVDNHQMELTMMSRTEQAHADALLARQAQQLQRKQEQLTRLQNDFSSKLGFLRQVYEARISDLEMKETTLKKKFAPAAATTMLSAAAMAMSTSVSGGGGGVGESFRWHAGDKLSVSAVSEASSANTTGVRVGSAGQGSGRRRGAGGSTPQPKASEVALVRDGNAGKGSDEEMAQLRARSDRDELMAARGEWRKTRPTLESGRKMREAAAVELDLLEKKTEAKKDKKRTDVARNGQ